MPFSATLARRTVALVLAFGCVVAAAPSWAQVANPIAWTFSSRKVGGDLYEVLMDAKVDSGWWIFSQNPGRAGPVPTRFKFAGNPSVAVQGPVKEVGRLKTINDPSFGPGVAAYDRPVSFVVTVKKAGAKPAVLKGSVEYMAATDHEALPPQRMAFTVKLD